MPSNAIQDAYATFTRGAALIEQEQLLVKSLVEREFIRLKKQKDQLSESELNINPVAHSFVFRDMAQCQPVFYKSHELSHDQLISALTVSHNRQYQWLLAECYELFEDFLIDAYGCAAAINAAFWDPKNLKDVIGFAGKNADWWVNQARMLKSTPSAKTILERMRQMPGVREIEQRNAHEVNYKLVLLMIDRMRHLIVHERGQVVSVEEFATNILSDAGVLSGGKPKPKDLAFIKQYFGDGTLNTTILLREHQLPAKGSVCMYVDMFGELIGWMLSYAHMLTKRL
jgi:hypothetical protein